MKKILLAGLMAVMATPVIVITEQKRMPVDRLQYGLCLNRWDRHFWGINTKMPKQIAQDIHDRLVVATEVAKAQNSTVDFDVLGKSLDQEYDAVIVHQCTILEQCMRATGNPGTVNIKTGSIMGYFFCPIFGYSKKSSGINFYNNACCFDTFYTLLTDEQLEQLCKGTEPKVQQKNWFGKNNIKGK